MSVEENESDDSSASWRAEFGKRLRDARNRAGMTHHDVQESLGYAPRSLTRWETGEVDPGIEKVARLAVLFGVSNDWLVGATSIERTIRPGMVLIDNAVLELLEHLVANGKRLRDVPAYLHRRPGINFAAIVPDAPEVVGSEAAARVEQRMRRAWQQLGGESPGGNGLGGSSHGGRE